MIAQEISLVPTRSVVENVFLGIETAVPASSSTAGPCGAATTS